MTAPTVPFGGFPIPVKSSLEAAYLIQASGAYRRLESQGKPRWPVDRYAWAQKVGQRVRNGHPSPNGKQPADDLATWRGCVRFDQRELATALTDMAFGDPDTDPDGVLISPEAFTIACCLAGHKIGSHDDCQKCSSFDAFAAGEYEGACEKLGVEPVDIVVAHREWIASLKRGEVE